MPNQAVPTPTRQRSGCKVGWYYYDNLADAEACAEWAEIRAAEMAGFGYDFGWLTPGTITECADGTFQVVIP